MPEQLVRRGKRKIWYAQCRYMKVRLFDCLETTDRRLAERRLAELKLFIERGEYKTWKKKFNDLSELQYQLKKDENNCKKFFKILR